MSDAYLVLYNAVMTVLSVLCAASVAFNLAFGRGLGSVWEASAKLFCVAQGLAFLETAHATIGLSRSSPFAALAQWVGKANVLVAILCFVPELQNTAVTATLLLVWSSSEAVRYYFYLLNIVLAGKVPDLLVWLRYNMFIPLYPLGMLAELRIMHLSVPYLKDRGTHGKFELGSFSLEYHAFIKYVTMVYPLLWLPLYLVMWKARAKKLRGKGKKEA